MFSMVNENRWILASAAGELRRNESDTHWFPSRALSALR